MTAQKRHVEKDFAITRFINICWYFFKLAAVLAVFVSIGLAIFLFTRLDDEIRRQAQQFLAKEFPQYNVSVGGARLVEGQGIAIYDLAISETTSTQLQSNVLVVDEIMFSCNAKLTELVKGLPEVHRVVVRHPQIWAAKGHDGSWNLSSFWPLPQYGKKKPLVLIENAQFTLADQSRMGLPSLSLRDVNLRIDPVPAAQSSSHGDATLTPAALQPLAEQPCEIHGSFGGPFVEQAKIDARFDPGKKTLQFSTEFRQLQITKGLMAWVAAFGGEQVGQTILLGKVDGSVTGEHRFGADQQPRVNAQLHLQEARLEDPRLPRPLVDLSCVIRCQNDLLTVEQLRGNYGSASVALQLQRRGWAADAPVAVGLRMQNLTLDESLHDALPMILRKEWDKYEPTGVVNVDVQATFDGHDWRPAGKLTGRDLTFTSDKFPYRVIDGYGTMVYTPRAQQQKATLDIDLTGTGGGQPLQFLGQVFDPRPGALGWIEVSGKDIEIEERMISALPGKTRKVIESMHPQGKFDVRWRLDRTQTGQTKPHTALQLKLVNCRVNYEKFPYPLSGIHGLVNAEDQHWQFRDLVSTGSRSVQCKGHLTPIDATGQTGQTGNRLFLEFTGQQIPLDDDLRHAMPPAVQQAWQELRPRGNVDMRANVSYVTGSAKPTISVAVSPRPESTAIKPKFFPYLMEQLEGSFSYQNGKLLMSQVRAQNGRTALRTNGNGEFRDDGSWFVKMEGLAVDRLMVRRELTNALPTKLQKLIEYLRPTGSFSLSNGDLQFSKASGSSATVESQWDLQLNCLQVDLQAGIELNNVHGAIRLQGAARGDKSYSAGELAIDTATFEDVQFTEIQGPLWFDQAQCLFGEWATKEQGQPLRRLRAKVYDGDVLADAWVALDVVPRYSAEAWLTGANLQRMMRERGGSQLDYQGKVEATLTVNGKGRSLATLVGHGKVQVTEANIYQLPILVSMLSVLRNETPTSTAFNQVDSKFSIQGPVIILDQLDFKGDAVSLLGHGETNFDHQLKLDFHTVVGRNEIQLPLVKKFFNGLGKQTMRMSVTGSMSDPVVRTQALPGINNLIQQIQIDSEFASPSSYVEPRKAERTFPAWPRWGRQ